MPSLFFRESGVGPPLILLHGFCETHEIWEHFVVPLAEHFRTITPDLPGFGRTAPLPSPFTIDQVGDSVASWLEESRIEDALVVGHSLGGYVSLSMARRHPQRVKALVLFHSTAFADTEEKKQDRMKIIRFVMEHGVQPYIDTYVPGLFFDQADPAIPDVKRIALQTSSDSLGGYLRAMMDREDRSDILQKSEIPKLIIAGVDDAVINIEISKKNAAMARNSTFCLLEKTAHMGLFEAKTESQTAIKRFAYRVFFNK